MALSAGAVWVFVRSGTTWSQQAYIKAPNTDAGDAFGFSVALSGDGNLLAVGSSAEDSLATGIDGIQSDNSLIDSGAVYTFTRSGAAWSYQSYIKPLVNDSPDYFGYWVALSGDGSTLVAGAPNEDSAATTINGDATDDSVAQAGAAYVFVRSGPTWVQQAYLKPPAVGVDDLFGFAVAVNNDGNLIAVGAPGDDALVPNSGAVATFTRSGLTWSQLQQLKAANPADGDRFGAAVAIAGDGSLVIVGAPGEDSDAIGFDGDQTSNNRSNSGAVYCYTRVGLGWSAEHYIKFFGSTVSDGFGTSVALSFDATARAGSAPYEDSGATVINGNWDDDSVTDSGAVGVMYVGR